MDAKSFQSGMPSVARPSSPRRPAGLSFLDIVTNRDDEVSVGRASFATGSSLENSRVSWTQVAHQEALPRPSWQADQTFHLPLQALYQSDTRVAPWPHTQTLPSLPQTLPEYATLASNYARERGREPESTSHCHAQAEKAGEAGEAAPLEVIGSIFGEWPPQGLGSPEQQDDLPAPLLDIDPMYFYGSEDDDVAAEAFTQAEDFIVADDAQLQANTGANEDTSDDAGYSSEGVSSSSTSAQSSIRDYLFENGRRYHRFREGAYNFPNDDLEQEREDLKHIMVKLLCGKKLHFAPIGQHPQEILDIGTGTGVWAIEMGDEYPSASVLGIDLSPIQPNWLPPNVKFLVDDAESPWVYQPNHFDYIHSRHTVMAIRDWPKLFRRAYEHLKPGGWIELQEIHHKPRTATRTVMPADHAVVQFWARVNEGLINLGVDLDTASEGKLADMMRDAGFVNLRQRIFHVPLGTWPKNKVLKKVGLYWRTILLDGLQAISLGPLTRGLRWDRQQVELFLMDVRRAYMHDTALMFMPLHIIYAQKAPSAVS